ncbi:unnamed protein product [Phytophthora fragariaefolia]|uniref:Unnamed protein product n=1 Tax=Phytophthora fragariaefolia TaxID=1490495 RepID=A0A9W6YAG2_9STRA|nr:unnamed protein product [Phytophthora fragariaefolia]
MSSSVNMATDSLCIGAAMEDVALSSATERRSREQLPLSVPSAFPVALTLKVGVPFGTSRSSYGAPQALQLDVVDGYHGFRARVHRKIDQMKEIEWPDDGPILLKPTAGATQAKFVALAEGDAELAVQLESVWHLAAKRKAGRIAAATSLIGNRLRSQPDAEPLGEASRAYWAVTHARQPDNAPLTLPTNPTFTQLRRIDDYQREIDAAAQDHEVPREFVKIRCRLNGGLVPLDRNLAVMRAALGLPSYDLRPPYRPPLASSAPTVNMEDADHMHSPDVSME